jgi:hypothetical protein
MATVLTGQNLSLTIGSDPFDAQTISTTFTYTPNREVLETLVGPTYKTLTFAYTLDVNMYSDWGATGSLCQALSDAALLYPDTPISFTLLCTGPNDQVIISGDVFPEVPPMTGEGPTASTVSFTLTGDRNTVPTILPY